MAVLNEHQRLQFRSAIGAALGGAVIREGLGYPAISIAGAAMAAAGCMVLAVQSSRPPVATPSLPNDFS
ncbi:hypothetical protein [Bradyrhizobium sp. CB1015]|uniref:hypothetical protein n=1 Tax=Bradyrhizobium sp. CB1015 TaxID=2976822 RepID=UPI0021AAF056|nr:hypothetical protein [Bradyrhizobium sp. CB1015]UWU92911.1 hypothetical protein N2604_02825 [Bradyrhizobium sp. CB1015]